MPRVTVFCSPSAEPMAMTSWPVRTAAIWPSGRVAGAVGPGVRRSARSTSGTVRSTRALRTDPSFSRTVTAVAPSTTWSLVTMRSGRTKKPVPRELPASIITTAPAVRATRSSRPIVAVAGAGRGRSGRRRSRSSGRRGGGHGRARRCRGFGHRLGGGRDLRSARLPLRRGGAAGQGVDRAGRWRYARDRHREPEEQPSGSQDGQRRHPEHSRPHPGGRRGVRHERGGKFPGCPTTA